MLIPNIIWTISRTISFAIDYSSVFGEQMILSYAEIFDPETEERRTAKLRRVECRSLSATSIQSILSSPWSTQIEICRETFPRIDTKTLFPFSLILPCFN